MKVWIDGHAWRPADTPGRPAPTGLSANEARRASDGVLLALQVAQAAVAMAGADAVRLASVFTSAHGDLAIVDALCRTLANDPLLLSPTRFHHSVHNAASGYWGIATGCRAPSTALAAYAGSAAAGWLEAACQVADEQRPLLLVGFDTPATGPLASTNASRGLVGFALVLAPAPGPASRWAVALDLVDDALPAPDGNPMAAVQPLFAALAAGLPATLLLPLDCGALRLRLEPAPARGPSALGHDG